MRLILLFLFSSLIGLAQQPFGKDATWYFNYQEFGYTGYKKVEHVSDTAFQGLNWLKFKVTGLSELRTGPGPNDILQDTNANFGNIFLATRNDSVFRIGNNGTPELLYDFTADVGDTWQFATLDTTFGCPALPVATVVAKGNQLIAGVSVPYIDIEMPMDTIMLWGQPVYQVVSGQVLSERIYPDFGSTGFTQLFQPSPNTCDGTVFKTTGLAYNQMRCFANANLNINLTNKACDSWSLISIAEQELRNTRIYPNPSNGIVLIDSKLDIETVKVFDVAGKQLDETLANNVINLPEIKGLYILHIHFKNGQQLIKKVIKK